MSRRLAVLAALNLVCGTALFATGDKSGAVGTDPAQPILALTWTEIKGTLSVAALEAKMLETLRAVRAQPGCLGARLFQRPDAKHFKMLSWWKSVAAVVDFQHSPAHLGLERWLKSLPAGTVEHAVGLYQRIPGGIERGASRLPPPQAVAGTRLAVGDRPVLALLFFGDRDAAPGVAQRAQTLYGALQRTPAVTRSEFHREVGTGDYYLVPSEWRDVESSHTLLRLAAYQATEDWTREAGKRATLWVELYQLVGGQSRLASDPGRPGPN